jgi:serine/threonine protein phosphatase PrpC
MKRNQRQKPSSIAVISEIGHRTSMEDTYSIDEKFVGLYDGHGGNEPACYARDHMPKAFAKRVQTDGPEKAFANAYKEVSEGMTHAEASGCCALNFYIKKGVIHYANVGDTELYVFGKDKKARELSVKHRVNTPTEIERLSKLGLAHRIRGRYLVHDNERTGLMVTRALGDQIMKEVGVTYEPHVGHYHIQPEDRYILAATDGLFDCVSTAEIIEVATSCRTAKSLVSKLRGKVIKKHGEDNLTIIAIRL